MSSNRSLAENALRKAEERFMANDLIGARKQVYEATRLCPSLPGLQHATAAFDVLFKAETSKVPPYGATDWYAVLGVDPSSNLSLVKKRYKNLCALTHPDKNRCVAAADAFKVVSQAWRFISSAPTGDEGDYASTRSSFSRRSTVPHQNERSAMPDDDDDDPAGKWVSKIAYECPHCGVEVQRGKRGTLLRCRVMCSTCGYWINALH